MINFNPTSLSFYFSGTELATQNIRCLLSLTDILNNPRHTISINYNQSQIDWLKVLDSSNNDITDSEQFGYPFNLKVKHNSSIILPDGNYSADISIMLVGESSGDLQYPIPYYDFGSFQVFLSVRAGISGFTVSPTSSILHLAKNSTSNPTQNLVFTSPDSITISGSDKFLVNGNPLPVTVPANSTVSLSTNNNVRTLVNGVYDYLLQFKNGNYNYGNLPVKVIVTDTNNLESFPSALNFKGTKGIKEPDWQNIYVYDPLGNVVIEIPDFIHHEIISDDNGFKTYSIKPKESNSLSSGSYNGVISFTSGQNVVKTAVDYELQGLYNTNYERSFHFTQDSEKLELVKAIDELTTFLRLKLVLKFYDFNGKETKIEDRILDHFFFESKVEFDPGQLIHDMFNLYEASPNERFSELNISSGIIPQYQFASIYFEVSEIDFSTLENKNSYVIPTQYYVKGRRPDIWIDNVLLTRRESQITKITKNSLIAFNFIKYDGGNLQLKLNNQLIELPVDSNGDTIPQGADVRIFGGIIKAADINKLKENDLIELSFNNQKLYYLVEEEGINSINVFYVNQWNLLSSFELTGEFTIDSDYERITTETFKNWVSATKTLHTNKIQKIKINSGFIPSENVKILDEIINSNRVFLLINGFTYEARPIMTKMNNQTSKNNLVDRQLEFELKNKNNDSFYLF